MSDSDSGSSCTEENVCSSSSHSSTSGNYASDPDHKGSPNKSRKNISSGLKNPVAKDDEEISPPDIDASFRNVLEYSLNSLRKIKGASNKDEELLKFYKWHTTVDQLTPEQVKKAKTLNIEMDDVEDDSVDPFRYKSSLDMYCPMSQEEVDMVKENWSSFCMDYGFDPSRDATIFFTRPHRCITKKQKRLFKHYISQHVNRKIRVVYDKFMELYSRRREEKFLPEEDELLLIWHDVTSKGKGKNRLGGIWVGGTFKSSVILARILQRPMPSLVQRLRVLLKNMNIPAKYDLTRERHSYEPPQYIIDIKNCKNDEYPDWTKDEESWKKMVEINPQATVKQLKKSFFLQLYPSVKSTSSGRVTSIMLKKKLIAQLSLLKNPSWENVSWKELGKNCFNVGAVKVYSVVRLLTKKYVPKERWGNLEAVIKTIVRNEKKSRDQIKKSPSQTSPTFKSVEFVDSTDNDD